MPDQMSDPGREPEPSHGTDEEGDVVPALDDDPAAWVAPAPGIPGEVPASGDDR